MKVQIVVPQEFPQDGQVRVVRWYKKHGEKIKKDEDLVEIEFSKAAITIPASEDGIVAIKEIAGGWLSPGTTLGWIQSADEPLEKLTNLNAGNDHSLQETSTLTVILEAGEILKTMDSLTIGRKKILPIILHEVFNHFSEISEFHQVWHPEGYQRPEKALIGMAFFSAKQVMIYPYEPESKTPTDIERWILKSAISAQKEMKANSASTLTITSLVDQDIFTFTPLLARGQAFTLGIGGDLNCSSPVMSLQATFDARALKGLTVAKSLQALKSRIQRLKAPEELKKLFN